MRLEVAALGAPVIHLLKRLVDWLDKRFPAKVYVSQEDLEHIKWNFQDHAKSITRLTQEMATLQAEDVALRKAMDGIRDTLVKEISPAVKAENRRAAFVASGRMGE